MAPSLSASFRALWHELTSNDRHASHNSPYRSGSHVPLPQNRHGPLVPGATTAMESRTDLNGTDLEAGNGFVNGKSRANVTVLQRQGSNLDAKMDGVAMGEIQMQNFDEGLPPPPPVTHSWKRIERWLEDNYEELFENIGEGATVNDINELEHELDCTLPNEVRDSLQVHDGQERGGLPTGIIFGCMLLDCEEIIQEWQNWRTVNEVYFGDNRAYEIPQVPIKAFAGSSSAAPIPLAAQARDPQWRQDLQDRQESQPPNAIQKVYAHPGWIPMARDWGGNNICIDLSPGPTGKWGQVILMGRDYDCKYVISRSWATFLATVADDMGTEKPYINEDTKELKLREFKQAGVEPAYIDILRWRSDQKFGRRGPKKRPLRVNSQVQAGGSGGSGQANGLSPYTSPTSTAEDRGRSPHRLSNGKAPATNSPRGHMSSPLARVAEESGPVPPQNLNSDAPDLAPTTEKLISIDTPRIPSTGSLAASKFDSLVPIDTPQQSGDDAEQQKRKPFPMTKLGGSTVASLKPVNGLAADAADEDKENAADEMKDVQI